MPLHLGVRGQGVQCGAGCNATYCTSMNTCTRTGYALVSSSQQLPQSLLCSSPTAHHLIDFQLNPWRQRHLVARLTHMHPLNSSESFHLPLSWKIMHAIASGVCCTGGMYLNCWHLKDEQCMSCMICVPDKSDMVGLLSCVWLLCRLIGWSLSVAALGL
jgi:hypothetical protein